MGRAGSGIGLRTRITLLVCAILVLVLLVTGTMESLRAERLVWEQAGDKALLLSQVTARSEVVVDVLRGRRPAAQVQTFTEQLRAASQVDFIVVMNMNRIRLSHPNPSLIGAQFVGGDDADVYLGRTYISTATGTLGTSQRAFVPVFDPASGRQIGAVSVGILVKGVDRSAASARRRVALGILVGFLVGVPGAFFLAGRIKRVLMGMEPVEIATLLQQRMALLHCVREGVVAIDRGLRITLVNEEASRLFELAGIQGQAVGRPVEEVLPHSGMAEVLASGQAEYDRDDAINGLRILASRVPVLVDGEITGVVATFRDRTELRQLAEQLSGVRHYADALRSQTHEFMNKLHVILGLIRLGEYQRLGSYIAGITDRQQDEIGLVTQRIKEPVIAGFLLARFSSAREQNVEMRMDEDSHVPPGLGDGVVHLVVTVLGNLLENAVESLAPDGERRVDLSLVPAGSWLTIRVADTGLGLAPEVLPLLFSRNFSTKGENRGFGLYHCARRLADAGGTLAAANREGCGAVFTAVLEIDAEVPE